MYYGEGLSMKIYSWNVNGIRAVQKMGFIQWLTEEQPDVLCLQETKAHPEQLEESLVNIKGYQSCWNSGERRGYSGVASYFQKEPLQVEKNLGVEEFDREGRILISFHENLVLLNVYFPNGQMGEERLSYKLRFYEYLINFCEELKNRYPRLVICGDFNTAHREIDLKNPKANEGRSGFLPVEREMLDRFLSYGYVDAFRYLYPEKVQYSWWSYRTRARERNAGWRIDCFYVSEKLLDDIIDCEVLDHIPGSDHCPISLYLK